MVDSFASWLKEKEPAIKGFDRRSIYRMQEFYIIWKEADFSVYSVAFSQIVGSLPPQLQKVDNQLVEIVATASPQLPPMPSILQRISWSHHLELLGKTKSQEERLFTCCFPSKKIIRSATCEDNCLQEFMNARK